MRRVTSIKIGNPDHTVGKIFSQVGNAARAAELQR